MANRKHREAVEAGTEPMVTNLGSHPYFRIVRPVKGAGRKDLRRQQRTDRQLDRKEQALKARAERERLAKIAKPNSIVTP